jgi:hypothetical protein
MFKAELFEALEDGLDGLGDEVEDAGAGAVIGALGGGVAEEETHGAAEVAVFDGEGPVDVAGAEGGEVVGPAETVDEMGEPFAVDGIDAAAGGGAGVVESAGFPFGGHGAAGGVIAPMVGAGGAEAGGGEGGLHG